MWYKTCLVLIGFFIIIFNSRNADSSNPEDRRILSTTGIPSKLIPLQSATCNSTQRAAADALQSIVTAPGTRSIMYLVAHDEKSYAIAKEISVCHIPSSSHWLNIAQISSTAFFESILYVEVLLANRNTWKDYDYVITGTYKTVSGRVPRWEHVQTFNEIHRLLNVAKSGDWDVVPFLRSGSGMMSNCLYWHKKAYKHAWDALLEAMNYTTGSIRKHYEMKPFFRNVYIIKTSVLPGLMAFMQAAITVARTDKKVAQFLARDSSYKEGNVEVSQRIFGTPYYQLHPFIFERLPAFYLHSINARMCHTDKGECAYNT